MVFVLFPACRIGFDVIANRLQLALIADDVLIIIVLPQITHILIIFIVKL